ncbi:hypothetical protein EYF80_012010 [Liparis tanakae]|uniref:Uncharacterized protein n=1 Tax=Liparis tanakae TaxID=230148 RepID=A0A4Z2IKA9_9TELE|nr:hypothetical protein EYF80_012010 [Liparis tanakae]
MKLLVLRCSDRPQVPERIRRLVKCDDVRLLRLVDPSPMVSKQRDGLPHCRLRRSSGRPPGELQL